MDRPVIASCCSKIVGCKGCMQKQRQSSYKCMKCQRPSQSINEVFGLQDVLRFSKEIQEKNQIEHNAF
uniref:Uncharacterized protein n=1 Tax=Anguilla anguilla TaxID=7936 RepID=A0A0E9XNY6_ANGAN